MALRLCAAALAHPGLAQTATATEQAATPLARPQRFREFVGLGVKFAQGEPLAGLVRLRDLQVSWVRDTTFWRDYEPTAGRYAGFGDGFQRRLRFYRDHDIGIVYVLGYGNTAAYPATPDAPSRSVDPDAFARYVADVAARLADSGVRFALQVWNEPHNSDLFRLLGGRWNGAPPSPWLTHYLSLVDRAVEAAARVDARIPVLAGDDMWVILYWMLRAGLTQRVGGLTIHPYQGLPERAAVAHDTDWTRPHQVVDVDRSFRSGVRRLREESVRTWGEARPIWITEMGWPVAEPGVRVGTPLPHDVVASYLPRAYIGAFAAGVHVMCWFSSQDTVDGPMGLFNNRGQPRPAYFAFRTMQDELGDATLVDQVSGQAHTTHGLQVYLFAKPDGRQVLAAWTADGAAHDVTLQATAAVGHDGRSLTLTAAAAPETGSTLRIDGRPVYLHGRWDAGELARLLARPAR